MGPIGNRRDSTHDICVGKRRYSAKTTLTHFIALAKLNKIIKIPMAGLLPKAMKKCTKNKKNFDDGTDEISPRQYT